MGTKLLGKGQKSKSSTTAGQGNCSSTNPLNPIREKGEIVDMEEQIPELVDDTEMMTVAQVGISNYNH